MAIKGACGDGCVYLPHVDFVVREGAFHGFPIHDVHTTYIAHIIDCQSRCDEFLFLCVEKSRLIYGVRKFFQGI